MGTGPGNDLTPLLEAPNFGYLGTVRPDGGPQVNPMWFLYDGEQLKFTHTTKRQKFVNLQHNDAMSLAVSDPANPYQYIEVRGRLVEVIDDPTGAFYVTLAERYGQTNPSPPPDAADRVILVMSIERTSGK